MGLLDEVMAVAPKAAVDTTLENAPTQLEQAVNRLPLPAGAPTAALGKVALKKSMWDQIAPLITGAAAFGAARLGGADPLTAGATGALAGLSKLPGPHQKAINTALSVFGTQNKQPEEAVKAPPTPPPAPKPPAAPAEASKPPINAALTPAAGTTPYSSAPPVQTSRMTVPVPGGQSMYNESAYGAKGGKVDALQSLKGSFGTGPPSKQKGVPNALKGLHLRNPAGLKMKSPDAAMDKALAPISPSKKKKDQFGFAAGGQVSDSRVVENLPKSEEIKRADTPKFSNGVLKDIALRSNENVKKNLPPAGLEKRMANLQSVDDQGQIRGNRPAKKFMHGGQVRGRMSESAGGPAIPRVPGEINPYPGGKKMASGGKVGGKFGNGRPLQTNAPKGSLSVRGAGVVVRGVRPAKKY